MTLVEVCAALSRPDLRSACAALSAKLDQLALNPILSAVIAGLVAVIGVLVTTRATEKTQRRNRHNLAQMEALYGLQDVSGKLRRRWIGKRPWIQKEEGPDPFPDGEARKLLGKFDIAVSRVADSTIRDSFEAWLEYAKNYYAASEEHQWEREQKLWQEAVVASGSTVRTLDGPRPKKGP